MKKVTLTFVLIAGLIFGAAKSYASGSVANPKPEVQLRSEIASWFNSCSIENLNVKSGGDEVWLSFLVDNNKKIRDISCNSDNELLSHYVKQVMDNKRIKLPQDLESKYYRVFIVFKEIEK